MNNLINNLFDTNRNRLFEKFSNNVLNRFVLSFSILLSGLFAILIIDTRPANAQSNCMTFDSVGVDYCSQWFISVTYCFWDQAPAGGHNSPCIRFTDLPGGPSVVVNSNPFFAGNWLQKAQKGCLCFDWMVDLQYSNNPPPTFERPLFGIYTGNPPPPFSNVQDALRAGLVAVPGAPLMQEDVWYNICLPIGPCIDGKLPSNDRFTWRLVNVPQGMDTCTAWNTLITNVTGIYLSPDYHSSPSERVYFDNFCFRCSPDEKDVCEDFWQLSQKFPNDDCCSFSWDIPNPDNIYTIAELRYFVTGGSIDNINVNGCSYYSTPSNLNNTITGSLTFRPPCNNSINVGGKITSTSSNGEVSVRLCARLVSPTGLETTECCETITINCPRALITQCDTLEVTPYIWPKSDLSGKTIRIKNQKQPFSPIKEVLISLEPDPNPTSFPYKWSGSGLMVDGVSRSWDFSNSGSPNFSKISLACDRTPTPQGVGAETDIKFNIGVPYLNEWVGNVILKVIHCDGDTCTLNYANWCGKRDNCIPDTFTLAPFTPVVMEPIDIRLLSVELNRSLIVGNPRAYSATIQPTTTGWSIVGASIDDGLTEAERQSGRYYSWNGNTKVMSSDRNATGWVWMEFLSITLNSFSLKTPWKLNATLISTETKTVNPTVAITFYDEENNPIKTDSIVVPKTVSSVPIDIDNYQNSSNNIKVVPNPANDEIKVDYVIVNPSNVRMELFDMLGKKHLSVNLGFMPAGLNSFGLSLADIANGSYVIRIISNDGVITAPLKIIR